MSELKYRGVPVTMAGQIYLVPALSVKQFRDNYEKLTEPIGEVSQETIAAQYDRLIPIIGMALRRNYPHVTDDHLWDMLDLESFGIVLKAMQNASGMQVVEPGEVEAPAAQTGAGSTAQ